MTIVTSSLRQCATAHIMYISYVWCALALSRLDPLWDVLARLIGCVGGR